MTKTKRFYFWLLEKTILTILVFGVLILIICLLSATKSYVASNGFKFYSIPFDVYRNTLLISAICIFGADIAVRIVDSSFVRKYKNLSWWIFVILAISGIGYILSVAELV